MQCPFCKGEMQPATGAIRKDNIHFEAYRCGSCGEELMDARQLKRLADRYRQLRQAREITFTKWGNSIAVRIPRQLVEKYKLNAGKHGLLVGEKEGIRIIPT